MTAESWTFAPVDHESYVPQVLALPDSFSSSDLCTAEFQLGADGALEIFYAPFGHINRQARICIMGLTPGWHQARIAIEAYRKALRSGTTTESALQIAGATASFEGMRTRLCGWLDKLGIADRLGIGSTTQLFEDSHSHLLHSTSLVRFPVFVGAGRSNYSGHNPRPSASPLLSYVARNILAREIQELPQALIVPLGRAVGDGLAHLSTPLHSLEGFPHPSGANGHGPAQFERNVGEMMDVVANFPWAG